MGECLRRARGAGWPPSGHSPRWRAETQPLCHLHRSSGSLQNGWTEEEALPQVRVPTKRCLSVPRASHIQQRGHVPEAGLPCQSSEHFPGMPSRVQVTYDPWTRIGSSAQRKAATSTWAQVCREQWSSLTSGQGWAPSPGLQSYGWAPRPSVQTPYLSEELGHAGNLLLHPITCNQQIWAKPQ